MKTNISIFAKPAYLNVHASQPFKYEGKPPEQGYLKRVSSVIRGEQIANFIGAKFNPTEGYQNDVCIYVKPPYKLGQDFLFEGRKSYLDICDAPGFYELLKKHPEVGVISASVWSYKILKKTLPNEIVNIPEHHCNFKRVRRVRKQITTVGCIGHPHALTYLPQGLKEQLAQRRMKLIEFSRFFTRADVIDFYMKIDIQIIWRPYRDHRKHKLLNPLKIVNASSFGIPTIAYQEENFGEMKGCYIPVQTLDEFFTELDKLKSNPKLYDQYAKRCIEKSEDYHIEKIAQLYRDLAS